MNANTRAPLIAVVDYGAGNLRSVAKALEGLNFRVTVTDKAADLTSADGVVFPGQGIAGPAMERLRSAGMKSALQDLIATDKPFFGVCLGQQLLFERTEEGDADCLGILSGECIRFSHDLTVPHMGWNDVDFVQDHPAAANIPPSYQFYFVHSYYVRPASDDMTLGVTDYGGPFASVVARGKLIATQFHPEKSGRPGLALYRDFFNWAI